MTTTAWLAAVCLIAVMTPTAAGELRLTLAYAGTAGSAPHDLFLKPWAQRLPTLSAGRLRVELLAPDPDGQTPGRLFERLRAGEADLVWAPIAGQPGAFPELSAFELPFMAWPAEAASQAALAFAREQAGAGEIQVLLAHADAPAWLHMRDAPVRDLAGLRGKRIYAPTPALGAVLETAGAEAVALPGPGQAAALLEQGELDGALLSFAAAVPAGIPALARYHTRLDRPPEDLRPRLPGLGATLYVLAMTAARFESQPQELRDLLRESTGLALAQSTGRTWDSLDRLARRETTAAGQVFHLLSESEHRRWQRAAKPVTEAWLAAAAARGRDGAALLKAARGLTARYYVEMAEKLAARTRPTRDKGGAQ